MSSLFVTEDANLVVCISWDIDHWLAVVDTIICRAVGIPSSLSRHGRTFWGENNEESEQIMIRIANECACTAQHFHTA
jgi:hypothetical protein